MSENPAPSTRSLNAIAVLLLVIALIAAFFVGHAITGHGSPDRATRGVYTEGTGSAPATPNQLSFTVTVTNTGPTTLSATTRTTAGVRAVKAALRRSGVADKDIQTGSIDLQPSYDNNGKINGYSYSAGLNVVIHDLRNASSVIASASTAAGNTVSVGNLSLDIGNKDGLVAQARRKAVADARSAAQALADATGRHLGKAVYIEEISASPTPDPIQYDSLKSFAASTAGAGVAGVPISPGTQTVSVSVKVRWALS